MASILKLLLNYLLFKIFMIYHKLRCEFYNYSDLPFKKN
jgi:hypothetical protein